MKKNTRIFKLITKAFFRFATMFCEDTNFYLLQKSSHYKIKGSFSLPKRLALS